MFSTCWQAENGKKKHLFCLPKNSGVISYTGPSLHYRAPTYQVWTWSDLRSRSSQHTLSHNLDQFDLWYQSSTHTHTHAPIHYIVGRWDNKKQNDSMYTMTRITNDLNVFPTENEEYTFPQNILSFQRLQQPVLIFIEESTAMSQNVFL